MNTMYNPDACLDIIEKASPVSVSRIRSYATLFTCYIWARYQSTRALDRMCACTETGACVMRLHYLDKAAKAHEMAYACANAMNRMELPRPGEPSKAWRKRRKSYQRMTEIIRRHWDESTGLYTWGNTIYGL